MNEGIIIGCSSTGDVMGNGSVGGLVAENYKGTIANCYSAVDVSGGSRMGGLVGYNGSSDSIITNCYSTGRVKGIGYDIGGLVGLNYGTVSASFWDQETSGKSFSDGGIRKTTAQMQTKRTFTMYGWDFVDVWSICEGTNYPRFIWQIFKGDLLCPDGVNFFDFSFFSEHWQEDNCGASNDCDGTDLDLLGTVDTNDLGIFVDNWLRGL